MLKKSLLYNIKLFPPQSHWKCRICITIWPRHIFSKFASMNSILSCIKNLSHTEHMLQTKVTKKNRLSLLTDIRYKSFLKNIHQTAVYTIPELYKWSVTYFTDHKCASVFFTVLQLTVTIMFTLQICIESW